MPVGKIFHIYNQLSYTNFGLKKNLNLCRSQFSTIEGGKGQSPLPFFVQR